MTTPVPIVEEGVSDAAVGDVFRIGVVVGVPASFVVIVALGLAAGVSLRQSVLLAVWPALVVGGFFGAQGALARITGAEERRSAMHVPAPVQREPVAEPVMAEPVVAEPAAADRPAPAATAPATPVAPKARAASKPPRPRGSAPTSAAAANETPTRRRPAATSGKKAATTSASAKTAAASKASSTPAAAAGKPAVPRGRRPRRSTS